MADIGERAEHGEERSAESVRSSALAGLVHNPRFKEVLSEFAAQDPSGHSCHSRARIKDGDVAALDQSTKDDLKSEAGIATISTDLGSECWQQP